MRLKDAKTALGAAIDADLPAFLWGAPGVGKSDMVREIGADRGLPVIDLRAALMDPVDLRGLPSIADGRAVWAPMGELPDAARDGNAGILFLDELNAAAPAVMAACFGLVLDRRLGAYELPDGWRVVAAGNRAGDRAAAQRMPSALANRFLHLDVDPDLDSWCAWALNAGIAPHLVAFLRFRPDLLHDFAPDRRQNPTPRAWSSVGRVLAQGLPDNVEAALIEGAVGEGPAVELLAFLRVARQMVSPDQILMDPNGAPVPDDPATMYAVLGALAARVTPQSAETFITYVSRVPAEYGVAAVKDATGRNQALVNSAPFIKWFSDNSEVYV